MRVSVLFFLCHSLTQTDFVIVASSIRQKLINKTRKTSWWKHMIMLNSDLCQRPVMSSDIFFLLKKNLISKTMNSPQGSSQGRNYSSCMKEIRPSPDISNTVKKFPWCLIKSFIKKSMLLIFNKDKRTPPLRSNFIVLNWIFPYYFCIGMVFLAKGFAWPWFRIKSQKRPGCYIRN